MPPPSFYEKNFLPFYSQLVAPMHARKAIIPSLACLHVVFHGMRQIFLVCLRPLLPYKGFYFNTCASCSRSWSLALLLQLQSRWYGCWCAVPMALLIAIRIRSLCFLSRAKMGEIGPELSSLGDLLFVFFLWPGFCSIGWHLMKGNAAGRGSEVLTGRKRWLQCALMLKYWFGLLKNCEFWSIDSTGDF